MRQVKQQAKLTYRSSKLNTILECPDIISVRHFNHVQIVLLLHVFHPLVCLSLRVNHQRPAVCITGNEKAQANLTSATDEMTAHASSWGTREHAEKCACEKLRNTDKCNKCNKRLSKYLIMMPFSIEKLSVGRPAMFQSLIFTGSPRVPVTEKSSEQGMLVARQAFTHSVVCS